MTRGAFAVIPDVAPVNVPVFVSWMAWDTILIFAVLGFVWIYLDRFGDSFKNAIVAGSLIWAAIFVCSGWGC